jgi:hypothetical protein
MKISLDSAHLLLLVLLLWTVVLDFTSADAANDTPVRRRRPRGLADESGSTIEFPMPSASELYAEAMELAEDAGHTFDGMTSSYTRLLTTLMSLGYETDEVNVVIPEFTSRKGVTVSPNPGRLEAERPSWQPFLSDDTQRLQDVAHARGQRMADFFATMGWADGVARGQDVSSFELQQQFGVETDRSLAAIYREWNDATAKAAEGVNKMGEEGERMWTSGMTEHTYNYQDSRSKAQCAAANARWEMAWRASVLDADEADVPGMPAGNYDHVLDQATIAAIGRTQRRGLATVLTDESAKASPKTWLASLRSAFRRINAVTPSRPLRDHSHVVYDASVDGSTGGTDNGVADVVLSDEDVSKAVCAFFSSLRRIISSNDDAKAATPRTMDNIRRLMLHFRSSVMRIAPEHVTAFFDADVVVIDGALQRYAVAISQLVFGELCRSLPQSAEVADGFDRFYRAVLEEGYFHMRGVQETVVRSIARDVPDGSAVVVAYPTRECRVAIYANGTVESDESRDCVAVGDMMNQLVATLDPHPFFTETATRYVSFEGPLLVAPRDSPARYNQFFARELMDDPTIAPERYVVRVDYRVEAFQWAPARGVGPDDGMPSFGEEIDAMIRAEMAQQQQQQNPSSTTDSPANNEEL